MNTLATSNSPYLRQHADNPVNWQAWSPEAFAEAKRRDVPVLVSIGYATCHWCHVMAHECFEDGSVASFMNLHFVCIKVDREEHPEVDSIYMDAVQAITGQGGWPLNAFTDAEGKPFFACTYLPPRQWLGLLDHLAKLWREERTRVLDSAAQLTAHLARTDDLAGVVPDDVWQRFDAQVRRGYDVAHPGMAWSQSAAPKFPAHQVLNALLTGGGNQRLAWAADMLTAMQDSGLHDRVGGGFHRYSVTRDWRLPHFEKMLYDNAQLMALYARAGVMLARTDFIQTAVNIGDYLLRDLRVEHAGVFVGYACAEDADDPNGEGSFYAWSPAELEAVLGAETAAALALVWNISPGEPEVGPHGHVDPVLSHIPHPRGAGDVDPAARAAWEQHLPLLRAHRDQRPRPIRDDKVLTDQNALALEGFAWLARVTGEARFIAATRELAQVLIARQRADGLARVVYPDGSSLAATITDYGAMVAGLMAAFNALGDAALVQAAQNVADEAVARLRADDGAFFTAAARADLIRRGREVTDNAWPAGQANLAVGCARLWAVTGAEHWRDIAQGIVTAAAQALVQTPAATATLLVAVHHLRTGPTTVVVTGRDDGLLAAARRYAPEPAVVIPVAACADQPWPCLAERNEPVARVHLCTAGLCHAPLTHVEAATFAVIAGTTAG